MAHSLQYYLRNDGRCIFNTNQFMNILQTIDSPYAVDRDISLVRVDKGVFVLPDTPLLLTPSQAIKIGNSRITADVDQAATEFRVWLQDSTVLEEPPGNFFLPSAGLNHGPAVAAPLSSADQSQIDDLAARVRLLEQTVGELSAVITSLQRENSLLKYMAQLQLAQLEILTQQDASSGSMTSASGNFSYRTTPQALFSNNRAHPPQGAVQATSSSASSTPGSLYQNDVNRFG